MDFEDDGSEVVDVRFPASKIVGYIASEKIRLGRSNLSTPLTISVKQSASLWRFLQESLGVKFIVVEDAKD